MQTTSEQWDTAWTLTMRAKRRRITNNVFDSTATFQWFRRNAMEMEEGGKEIQEDIEYDENVAEWMSGHQELNTDEVEIITSAFYKWRYIVVPVTIAFDTQMEARKASNVMGVLAARTQNSMKTLQKTMNAAMWGAQSGVSMLGMQDICADDSDAGTLGGLSRLSLENWRNYAYTTATTWTTQTVTGIYNGVVAFNSVYNNISDGGEKPDVAFTGTTIYGKIQDSLAGTGYSRFEATDPKKKLFNGVPQINGVPILRDNDVAASHIYLLNSDFVKLKVQSGVNLTKTPFKSPHNQLSQTAFIVLSCQLITNKPKRQGVLTAVS